MAAGKNRHNLLKTAIAVRLQNSIDAVGVDCSLFGDGVSVVIDTGEKLEAYLGLPSVRHYLVFDPVRRVVVHHGRADADAPVTTAILHGGTLELPPTGLALDVDACFAVLGPKD